MEQAKAIISVWPSCYREGRLDNKTCFVDCVFCLACIARSRATMERRLKYLMRRGDDVKNGQRVSGTCWGDALIADNHP